MLSDGESLDDGDLLTVPDGIDVDVLTNTPWGLGMELLEEIKDSLLEVFKRLQGILDGAEVFAASMLDGIYASLDWIGEVADGFRDAYPEYGGALPDAAPLRRSVETFQELMAAGRLRKPGLARERVEARGPAALPGRCKAASRLVRVGGCQRFRDAGEDTE